MFQKRSRGRRKRRIRSILAVVLGVFAAATYPRAVRAATIIVDTMVEESGLPSNGNCSVREAVQAANQDLAIDGCAAGSGTDQVVLPAGTMDMATNVPIEITSPVDIVGAGRDVTSFHVHGGKGFEVAPVQDMVVSFTGIAMSGADVAIAGGLYAHISSATFSSNEMAASTAYYGGTLVLDDVELLNNGGGRSAVGARELIGHHIVARGNRSSVCGWDPCSGGAIDAETVTLTDSELSGNAADFGGAISAGSVHLVRCRLFGNCVSMFGGAIGAGTVDIEDSEIAGNCAWQGGGLAIGDGTIVNSTISGNSSHGVGRQIALKGSGDTLILTNVTIGGYPGRVSDGAHVFGDIEPEDWDYTFGIRGPASPSRQPAAANVTLINTIISGNCSTMEGRIHSGGGNLESPGNTCFLDQPSDLTSVPAPGIGPLQFVGDSPTKVHPLLPGSVAIDSGLDASCPPTDQIGTSRPLDGNGDGLAQCDRGAFEALACTGPDDDGDGAPDACDTCPDLSNAIQSDTDGDGVGDACDDCPLFADPDQADANGNTVGDACELLIDGFESGDTSAWSVPQ